MKGLLLAVAVTGIMALAPMGLRAQGDKPPAKAEPQWKDRAEYDLADAIAKDTNPQTKLEKLNEWKAKYPATDFLAIRQRNFLRAYADARRVEEALNTAKEILATDPNDFYGIYYTAFETPLLAGTKPTEDQLSAAEKASNAILSEPPKPTEVADADWSQIKSAAQSIAHKTLGWVALQRNQYDNAEAEIKKVLAATPNDSEVSFWLGIAILRQQKTDRYPEAFYDYARAAAYDGPGSLAPPGRATVKAQLQGFYTKFHGSAEGLEALLELAKNSPTPPPDFKILSTVDQGKIDEEKGKQEDVAHPDLAIWRNIKAALQAPEGAAYFAEHMKDVTLPGGYNGVQKFKGKVISMQPALKPRTVVIGVENGSMADAKLKFETPLTGKVELGTELAFSGRPESFTAAPFQIVFNVDKKDLEGWTGTNPKPVTRTPVRRRAAH
jgi:tetratricopeptide (TPR) repeat protein